MLKILIASFILVTSSPVFAQKVIVNELLQAPKLDGLGEEWDNVPQSKIKLKPTLANSNLVGREVLVQAGHFNGQVYFYLQWPDSTESVFHKPYIWNEKKQRYGRGLEREDRLAIQFQMSGEYSTDWANAENFKADMWHWKASRSNPLGLAHDKKTTISKNKLLRAANIPSKDGTKRYVLRESDEGTPIYRSLRYGKKEQDVMPKYELLKNPRGSIADVKANGKWQDGFWHLELSRNLNTGNNDDVNFVLKQTIPGGIAIFDASENDNHLISETIQFQF